LSPGLPFLDHVGPLTPSSDNRTGNVDMPLAGAGWPTCAPDVHCGAFCGHSRRPRADWFDGRHHRSPTFLDDLSAACGETGVHVFSDNVGGPILNPMLPVMARRVVCSGAATQYH
jgi:hypothetical protein